MKIVLVTGAAQGIGLATCCHLARNGYFVYAMVRASSETTQLDEEIEKSSSYLCKVIGDVTDSISIQAVVKKIIQDKERIDVVINCACSFLLGTCETCTIEEQEESMNVNYFGAVRILQAVLPYMRLQRSGLIIQMGGIAGYEPFFHLEPYVASKFALEGLIESLASHLRAWNIQICLVEPEGVNTQGPRRAKLGSRSLQDTQAYEKYLSIAKQKMVEGYGHSMLPIEVVKVIEEILNEQTPHLRYPVGEFAKARAKERFQDPSGEESLRFKKQFLSKFYPYDVLGK